MRLYIHTVEVLNLTVLLLTATPHCSARHIVTQWRENAHQQIQLIILHALYRTILVKLGMQQMALKRTYIHI
jgi:hypothetical protein